MNNPIKYPITKYSLQVPCSKEHLAPETYAAGYWMDHLEVCCRLRSYKTESMEKDQMWNKLMKDIKLWQSVHAVKVIINNWSVVIKNLKTKILARLLHLTACLNVMEMSYCLSVILNTMLFNAYSAIFVNDMLSSHLHFLTFSFLHSFTSSPPPFYSSSLSFPLLFFMIYIKQHLLLHSIRACSICDMFPFHHSLNNSS